MLSLKTIAYATTFLATSASLNFVTNAVKNSLPEIDMKTLEATSPYLEYAAVASSWAVFGLKIYAAHYTGMGAVSAISSAIDVASGAYALVHNPEIINAIMPALAGVAGYMPNMAALVPGIGYIHNMAALVSVATGVITHNLESLSTYDVANIVLKGTLGCSLEDLESVVNLANLVSIKDLASVVTVDNLVGVIDIASIGMIGVSASDLINSAHTVTSLFGSALDYDLL